MPVSYQKIYSKNNFIAFAPAVTAPDHVFLWPSADGATPLDLKTLLTKWDTVGGTLLFCQLFDLTKTEAAIDALVASAVFDTCKGKLAYWRDPVFTGIDGPFKIFPDPTTPIPVPIADIRLRLDQGTIPGKLSDFSVGVDATGNNLTLHLANAVWSIDTAVGGDTLVVALDSPQEFVAGGVGLELPWPTPDAAHPLNRTGFVFNAAPADPADGSTDLRVWSARLSDKVVPSTGTGANSRVHLDPRDDSSNPQWLNNKKGEMNSSFHFGDAEIHSSYYSAQGNRFSLVATPGAACRLGFIYDQLGEADQTVDSTFSKTIFHPEGFFEIHNPAPATKLNIGSRDFIAGSAATEFFDLGTATHIEFVKQQPCFLIGGETVSPTQRTLLDDRKGLAITSHLRFAAASGANPPATTPVNLHSQPAESPLFISVDTVPDHLVRRRKEMGPVSSPVPIFPRAGYNKASDDGILGFDATHLSQFRRNQLPKAPPPAPVPADLEFADAPVGTLAITPQGILAQIDSNFHYTQLYFGNPDSSAFEDPKSVDAAKIDFSITISPADAELFADLQNALAGNHLFLVFNNPKPEVLKTISPGLSLNIRGFSLSVSPALAADPPAGTNPVGADVAGTSVVIVKYFTGASLNDLVNDPSKWACQSALAPAGNAGIRGVTHLDDPVPPNTTDYLADLRQKWADPNWQGILVLNLGTPDMPTTLEALRPGLPKDTALRANHLGLNVVPAKQSDLNSTGLPKRLGSAFGVIRFDKKDSDIVTAPDRNDHEPGATPAGEATTNRQYGFVLQALHVVFDNSQISTFDAKLFVTFSHLFWDQVNSDGSQKSLELDGHYESRAGQDVFSLTSPNQMSWDFPDPSLLQTLTISSAQLNVQSFSTGNSLTAAIDLDCTLTLKEKLTSCPLFSVSSIGLSSFGFKFIYNYNPVSFQFGFDAPRISVNVDFNPAANGLTSLLNFLPVELKGMSIALSDLLDVGKLGFTPISFPGLDTGGLTGTAYHFAFLMDLDLGSLGQLSGDLSGLRIPMLLGWRGGSGSFPRIAFGIQFPTIDGKIDIGIQQFIRLQAEALNLQRCPPTGQIAAFAIQAVNARVILLGKSFPQQDLSFAIFVPATSNRKMSWALGLQADDWYVGGGYRITIDGSAAPDTKGVVADFEKLLNSDSGKNICSLLSLAAPASENWSIAAEYNGDSFDAAIAVADPGTYGINLAISDFDLDLLYRKVAGQLGIFSIEFSLPGELRTMQFGAATVRLPVFRLEIHTDGGFLADFGYPWNNDFSRSAQVEVAIFLGSGGFYYGVTSALASDLLQFAGGYGYSAPDTNVLAEFKKTVRVGFAARVGIGRSFTIGILSAEASITIFGGIEGAVSYKSGETNLFNPTIYAIRGFVGLMLDISATVSFAIIQASARLLAYADVGLELRKVLAKSSDGQHHLITLPLVVFADVGLEISITVSIHIGCFDISINLSFSATWHFEETLGHLSDDGLYTPASQPVSSDLEFADAPALPAATTKPPDLPFGWTTTYRYWNTARTMNIYGTTLPCMGDPADFGQAGAKRPCIVGTMMLQVKPDANCFGDLVRFLSGWVLLNGQTPGADPNITLGALTYLQEWMKKEIFWAGFPDALATIIPAQFTPTVLQLSDLSADQIQQPFAVIPLWPGYSFSCVLSGNNRTTGVPAKVVEHTAALAADNAGNNKVVPHDIVMSGDAASFAEYCRHLIASAVAEMIAMVRATPGESTNDSDKFLKWSDIWKQMF